MPLFGLFSSGNIITRRRTFTSRKPEFTLTGNLVTLPISLSSNLSNVVPGDRTFTNPDIPEFTAIGRLSVIPMSLSSSSSNIVPGDRTFTNPDIPEFTLNGNIVTLPISLSSGLSNVVI